MHQDTNAMETLIERYKDDAFFFTWHDGTSGSEDGSGPETHQRLLVLDASFNPPTKAHYGLLLEAWRQHGHNYDAGLLLFSINNADKQLNGASVSQRLCMMELLANQWRLDQRQANHPTFPILVGLTTKARFIDKIEAIHQHAPWVRDMAFIVGMDTMTRLFDPKYYPGELTLQQSLEPLFSRASLIVADRPGHDDPAFWHQPAVQASLHRIHRFSLATSVATLSSTLARQAILDHQRLEPILFPDIIQFIQQQHLYQQ
ncbi:Nucleotidylyl transferase [Hesseltinella vesiculosa]|uniref:Nucleotidylyl transferase n=1 Tax=Hesseltinella vesiculosa TaxID=101127 RepID=A0A1X2GYQ5_9FUNG|nr:Nucleotidylyl transferase [Hesseltinella vesiculosa]